MPILNGRNRADAFPAPVLTLAFLALVLPVPSAWAQTALPLTVQHEGRHLVVRSPFYQATIAPENGGRIISFIFQGTEMTGMSADGHGGLMEEVHTADFAFDALDQTVTGSSITLVLAANAGELRVVKRYTFSADRPWIAVGLTFENRSRFRLMGAAAPAVRALALVGGQGGAARAFYCLDRGRGTEALSADLFLAAVQDDRAAALRWIAVADPVSRRALGFALEGGSSAGSSSPLAGLRADGGAVVLGWSYPDIPPGMSLEATVLIVPLDGYAAVAELNDLFVAESLVEPPGSGAEPAAPLTIRFDLTPLRDELRDVSIVTRVYDESGEELSPADSLLFSTSEPLRRWTGRATWPGRSGKPAWLLVEVYSLGKNIGRFTVPFGSVGGDPPIAPQPPGLPRFQPVEGAAPAPAGSLIPISQRDKDRGFLLWRFDGGPALAEMNRLDLILTQEEDRTEFLGVKALRPIEKLRLTLAGAGPQAGGPMSLPPAAVYLWQVREDEPGRACMTASTDVALAADETAWFAVTADSRQLKAGQYSARLVVSADDSAVQVPLSVTVLSIPAASASAFGLWHIGEDMTSRAPADPGGALAEPSLAKLGNYGVSALTVPLVGGWSRPALNNLGRDAARRGLALLSFTAGDGATPPTAPFPGRLLLPYPDPLWLLRAGSVFPTTVRAACEESYAPAILCERINAVPQDLLALKVPFEFWLVADGCEPGLVPEMVQSGAVPASATVWLYLDLRDADWQRAAVEVRSAFWAAAWQGLAGAAVRCPVSAGEADRELVIWHILRDAREEAALWREASRLAATKSAAGAGGAQPAPAGTKAAAARRGAESSESRASVNSPRLEPVERRPPGSTRARDIRRVAALESVVGADKGSDLLLRLDRRPFRRLYRVAPSADRSEPVLDDFEAARRKVLGLMGETARAPIPTRTGQLYWRGIPLVEDGRVRWAIVIADGEPVRRAAAALQKGVEDATGNAVRISRAFPDLSGEGPRLVWAVAGEAGCPDWPEAVRAAVAEQGEVPLATVGLGQGVTIALLRSDTDIQVLLKTFRRDPSLYPTASDVR
jgi:hypothetical protein